MSKEQFLNKNKNIVIDSYGRESMEVKKITVISRIFIFVNISMKIINMWFI